MKKIISPIIYTALLLVSACTKEIVSSDVDYDIPVVEAFLEPGKTVSVKLTKMLPFTVDEFSESLIIDTAEVYINYNGIDYLLDPIIMEPGLYESSDPNLIAIPEGMYNLSFNYKGKKVMSSTKIPSEPIGLGLNTDILYVNSSAMGPGSTPQDPMTVSWGNSDNCYHLMVVEYLESTYDPISENLDSNNFTQFRKVSTDPIFDNSYDLNTRSHLVFFGDYRVILYKVNKEYVDLYENVSQSSLSLSEPLTNIVNGLGIFTGMTSDTVYLKVKEL